MKKPFLVVLCVLLLASACTGKQKAASSVPSATVTIPTVRFPAQVLGLVVKTEDIAERVKDARNLYFDRVALYSFRETDNLLRATLQLSHFGPQAEPQKESFRRGIIGGLGTQVSQQIRVGDQAVYLTGGNQQNIFVWFRGRSFYALSVRSDYLFPRTLLRRILGLDLR